MGQKCLGIWLFCLASLYLVMSLLNWNYLTEENFYRAVNPEWTRDYAKEMYKYTVEIEEIKAMHAGALMGITGFITYMTYRNKVMSKREYLNTLAFTFFIYIIYIIPCIWIAKKTYDKNANKDENDGAVMFADWIYMMLKKTDFNVLGFGFAVFVHAQIFMIIFGM